MPITQTHLEVARVVNSSGAGLDALAQRSGCARNTIKNLSSLKRDVRLGNVVRVLAALGYELRIVKARRGGRQ